MTTLVILYLNLLAVGLVIMMLVQYVRGTHELLSVRNVALLGFVIFQLTGATGALSGEYAKYAFMLENPGKTGLIYAAMATVLVLVFLWSYNRGLFVKRIALATPTTHAIPNVAILWGIAAIFVVAAAALRFGIEVPLLHQLATIYNVALMAAACGIAGWIWGPRFLNPIVVLGVLAVVLTCVLIVLSDGAFGRRPLVAFSGALLWGLYYSQFRYLRPSFVLPRLALVLIPPLLFIAVFTSARTGADKDRPLAETMRAMARAGDLGEGLRLLLAGQDAGANSLWLIEQFPGPEFKTRPFFTIGYAIVYPVPRMFWTSKPEPLSTHLPHMALVQNVNRDALTLGPGIIGHAAAEGGWFALLAYALLGGLLIRLVDELVRLNTWSPFVVLPIGVSFGQVLGFARGETAAFIALFVLGVSFTYFAMVLLGKMLERVSGIPHATYEDVPHEAEAELGHSENASAWDVPYEHEPYEPAGMG